MNKTININLGGLFFHIDENAYQKLNRYLNAIRKSLSDDPQGRDEIIKDIELRISELLSDKVIDERQVVSEADIDTIIGIMGQPEDYNVDEELFTDNTTSYSQNRRKKSKKLYRDVDDKFLGGVAAGTAHYIGIEPIWARIFWLIMAFGIGFGFLIYPLLWILLPKAESTSEKLEMEGERVNIDNIERKIREEFSDISTKLKDGANELSDTVKKKYRNNSKSGFQELLDTLGNVLMAVFKVFAKFIGVLIIFISAIVLLALIISLFSVGSVEFLGLGNDFIQYPRQFFDSYLPHWLIALLVFAVIAIPIIVLFMLGLKILSNNTKSFSKVTSLTLLAIWILSILGLIFSGIDFASRYKYRGLDSSTQDITLVANDTLSITMVGNDDYNISKRLRHSNNMRSVNDNGTEKIYSADVNFDIRKSNSNDAYIKIRKIARGRNRDDANQNAERLEYQFNLNNSDLKLNGYFLSDFSTSFFDQEIDVILYLPEGTTVYLDNSTRTYLDDVTNVQNIYDGRMTNHYYIMNKSELDCLDCNTNKGKEIDVDTENIRLKINDEGLDLKINTDDGDVKIKIDENGVTIK